MNVIELQNINYARSYMEYPLQNIQLTVKQGELIHLKGSTGSGKSTLVDLILGIREPDNGEVKVFGYPSGELRSKFLTGVAPQKIRSPIKNAQLGRLIDLIESHYPGGEGKINSILKDFDLNLSKDKEEFSGGEERILFFALAQAGSPKLLIVDEPTTFLDTEDTEDKVSKLTKFWEQLQNFHNEGNTVLLVCHDREIGVKPTRVFRLKNGELNESSENSKLSENIPFLHSAILNRSEPLVIFLLWVMISQKLDVPKSFSQEFDLDLIDGTKEIDVSHWISLLFKHVWFSLEQIFQVDKKYLWFIFTAGFLWSICISFLAKVSDDTAVYTIVKAFSFYLAMSATNSTGNIIAEERQNEILIRLLKTLPLPPIIYLSAKVIASWLINFSLVFTMLVTTLICNIISPSISLFVLPSLLGSLMLGIIPYLFLGLALGYLFDKPKNIQIASLIFSLTLSIPIFSQFILNTINTVFTIPIDLNLASLIGDYIAAYSPIYHYIQLALYFGKSPEYDQYLGLHLIWLIWFTLISILIALWTYWRTSQKEAKA